MIAYIYLADTWGLHCASFSQKLALISTDFHENESIMIISYFPTLKNLDYFNSHTICSCFSSTHIGTVKIWHANTYRLESQNVLEIV